MKLKQNCESSSDFRFDEKQNILKLHNYNTSFIHSNLLTKMKIKIILAIVLMLGLNTLSAQTFTMGKKCRASLETAKTSVSSDMYSQALEQFDQFSSKCKTKDAKEAAAVGKAEANNGLDNYSEAIAQADIALKITKGKSLNGHFQKAIAQNKMGDIEGSKNSLNSVMELTENNQNIKERAKNYALMAALYERQLSDIDSAQTYLNKAKQLDPTNVNFLIQEGTMYSTLKDFSKAFDSYDEAQNMSPDNLELALARSNTRLRMMENKYNSKKAQDLRGKMTAQEKNLLCSDLKKAKALGHKDMNKDMFIALVCK
jgi:tetratricopeptide (TPR) repeat protein